MTDREKGGDGETSNKKTQLLADYIGIVWHNGKQIHFST